MSTSGDEVFVVDSSHDGEYNDENHGRAVEAPSGDSSCGEGESTSSSAPAAPLVDVGVSTDPLRSPAVDASLHANLLRLAKAVAPNVACSLEVRPGGCKLERPCWKDTLERIQRMPRAHMTIAPVRPLSLEPVGPQVSWLPQRMTALTEAIERRRPRTESEAEEARRSAPAKYLVRSESHTRPHDMELPQGPSKGHPVDVVSTEDSCSDAFHLSELQLILSAEGTDSFLTLYAELQTLRHRQRVDVRHLTDNTRALLCCEEALLHRIAECYRSDLRQLNSAFCSDCSRGDHSIESLQTQLAQLTALREGLRKNERICVPLEERVVPTANVERPPRSEGAVSGTLHEALEKEWDGLREEIRSLRQQLANTRQEKSDSQERYNACVAQTAVSMEQSGFVRKEVFQQMHLQRRSLLAKVLSVLGWSLVEATGEMLQITSPRTGRSLSIGTTPPYTVNSVVVNDIATLLAGIVRSETTTATGPSSTPVPLIDGEPTTVSLLQSSSHETVRCEAANTYSSTERKKSEVQLTPTDVSAGGAAVERDGAPEGGDGNTPSHASSIHEPVVLDGESGETTPKADDDSCNATGGIIVESELWDVSA